MPAAPRELLAMVNDQQGALPQRVAETLRIGGACKMGIYMSVSLVIVYLLNKKIL
jgi:hypothetical protein